MRIKNNHLTKERTVIPAIYHLEAKVITRGVGRSAVAASAYMSCSEITNEYDGVKHDYTRKGGLVYEKIFLPSHAPPKWCDRSKLWNAVEETEKTRNSRLAREFIVALPVEVSRERQEEYARHVKQQEEWRKQLEERRKNRNNQNIKNKNERSR